MLGAAGYGGPGRGRVHRRRGGVGFHRGVRGRRRRYDGSGAWGLHGPALAASDVGIGLLAPRGAPAWGAHLLCRDAAVAQANTAGLVALVGTQLGQTLAVRGRTPLVAAASAGSLLALAGIVQTPGISHLAGSRPLLPHQWAIALTRRLRGHRRATSRPQAGTTRHLVVTLAQPDTRLPLTRGGLPVPITLTRNPGGATMPEFLAAVLVAVAAALLERLIVHMARTAWVSD